MTIYFYTSSTPTQSQISELFDYATFFEKNLQIQIERTPCNEIKVILSTRETIFLIDVLISIQNKIKSIFHTSSVFIH